MPQHLHIEIDGKTSAEMSTSHVSDTCYNIRWNIPGAKPLFYAAVDTGVQRQPSDTTERQRDFQNDFIHVQRSIGAALSTARRVLEDLPASIFAETQIFERIVIRLSTNAVDRGTITISIQPPDQVAIQLLIGSGPNRPPSPIPANVAEFEFSTSIDGAGETPLKLALQAIESQGYSLIETLATHTLQTAGHQSLTRRKSKAP